VARLVTQCRLSDSAWREVTWDLYESTSLIIRIFLASSGSTQWAAKETLVKVERLSARMSAGTTLCPYQLPTHFPKMWLIALLEMWLIALLVIHGIPL